MVQIDDEVITYTGKTEFSFTGCIRGFVGITSYRSELNKEEVVFKETESDDHKDQSIIKNLSCLFLKEFLLKTKHQLVPMGREDEYFWKTAKERENTEVNSDTDKKTTNF